MRRRFLALTLALSALLGVVGEAHAHRLKAACRFLPNRVVCVDTWFDNGDTPKKGHVQVRGADGQVLREGQLNRDGLYQFNAPDGRQGFRVVVDAGDGHHAEVAIRPEQITPGAPPESAATTNDDSAVPPTPAPVAPLVHEEPLPIKDMLTGIGLLIAVAALALSLRNARSLRELRRSRDGEPREPPG